MKRAAVYKLLIDGELAYVGSSTNPKTRLQAHRARKQQFRCATMEIIRWYASVGAARVAEKRLIEHLRPPYNAIHNPSRLERRRSDAEKSVLEGYVDAFFAEGANRPSVNAKYERKMASLRR